MATIRLVGVSKTFPGASAPALDDVSLTVRNGETMAIVGPSGSGKSTLLRLVAGLDSEYRGQVLFDGVEVRDMPPKERHIGMVFQNYALYPHFPGHGNLSFFFRLRKITDAETEARIRATSEIMGIGFEQLLPRKPGTLSGGQQQRVAIGRALVRNPRIFLLDEPLSNLDAKLRVQTRIEIKRLLQRFKITTLYVTHDQTEAIALGDQIAVMQAGRIAQVGPVQTLLRAPVSVFVAGFVGVPPMNLIPAQVRDGALHFAGAVLALPPRLRALVYPDQAITVGIRPEAVQWVDAEPAASDGLHLHGRVELIEPDMGRRLQWLHIRRAESTFVAGAPLTLPLHSGDDAALFLPSEELHFFDSTTGLRL